MRCYYYVNSLYNLPLDLKEFEGKKYLSLFHQHLIRIRPFFWFLKYNVYCFVCFNLNRNEPQFDKRRLWLYCLLLQEPISTL